jgi:hypothetical protein
MNRFENAESGIAIMMSTMKNERRRTKDVRVFTAPENGPILARERRPSKSVSQKRIFRLIRLYKSVQAIQWPMFLNGSPCGQLPRLALNLRLDFAPVFAS